MQGQPKERPKRWLPKDSKADEGAGEAPHRDNEIARPDTPGGGGGGGGGAHGHERTPANSRPPKGGHKSRGGGGGGGGNGPNGVRGGGTPAKDPHRHRRNRKRGGKADGERERERDDSQEEAARKKQEQDKEKERLMIEAEAKRQEQLAIAQKEQQERAILEELERKKREEEHRIAKEAEAKARAEEIRKAKQAKLELRAANLAAPANRPNTAFFKTLDSSLKKNTAYIKKLAKLGEDQRERLCAEFKTLNLSRYVSEAVASITEAKLKNTDINAAVQICSLMHQRYAEFQGLLMPALLRTFETPTPKGNTELLTKKRITFRLITELFLVGLLSDTSMLVSIVKELVTISHQEFRGDREGYLTAFHFNLMLVTSFTRAVGEDVLGIVPEKLQPHHIEIALPQGDTYLSAEHKKQLLGLLKNFYRTSSDLLVEEHKHLRARERDNNRVLQTKGELSEADRTAYDKIRKTYETLMAAVTTLAELLNEEMPQLPEEENTTRVATVEIVQPQTKGNKATDAEPIWNDEDTRSFYEDLPQLRLLVPAVLFGDESSKDDFKSESDTKSKAREEDKEVAKETRVEDSEEDKEKQDDKTAAGGVTLEGLLQRLPSCVNRDLIDRAAVDFCYVNSKGNRKKLVKTLFNVPRTQLALLPHYARMVATLNQCMKDIAPLLVSMLEEEFNHLLKKKDQINIETKLKNIRFLGELSKFKIAPSSLILGCLKECLDDFVFHNIEVACALLETCGRFLYRSPETHVRSKNMLDIMMRLKKSKNLDNRLDTMVENAYYQCIPPERVARQEKLVPPLLQFIQKLVYTDLNRHNVKTVLKLLRKLPWPEQEEAVTKTLLAVHKGKYSNVHILASLTAGLARFHDSLGVALVDLLLERIRVEMDINDYKRQQRRVVQVKYLGELYNYRLIENNVIFYVLYALITYRADDAEIDPPDDLFRVRLACTLLDTCGKYFDRGITRVRLDRYLYYFQRYYLAKAQIPLDIDFMIADTLEVIRPKLQRFSTFEEACYAIDKLEAEEAAQSVAQFPRGPIYFDSEIRLDSLLSQQEPNDEEEEHEEENDEDEEPEEADDDDEEGRAGARSSEDEEEEEGEDQTEETGPEDEEAEPEVRIEKEVDPEEEEFERELKKMVRESVESRKLEARSADISGMMTIPMDLFSKSHPADDGLGPNDPAQKQSTAPNAVKFKVLMRRGHRQQVRALDIPMECALAVNRSLQREEEQREHQEIKRLTLEAYDTPDDPDDNDAPTSEDIFGDLPVPVVHVQANRGRGRPTQRERRAQFTQQSAPRGSRARGRAF